jgi:hypothetical protein
VSFWDRVQEVVPHSGRAWIEAVAIGAGLIVVILLVLPRLLKRRSLRWAVSAALVLLAGWLTVLPVFFDKRVDERLLGTGAGAAAAQTTTNAPTPTPMTHADPPPGVTVPVTPPPRTTAPGAGPVRLTTGALKGLAGHYGRGAASVYRLADGSSFVRLEDIDTPRAPAVFVYLVPRPGQTGPEDAVDLGALKGNQGSQNYVIPSNVDVSRYQTVLLWCRRFSTPIANATQLPA